MKDELLEVKMEKLLQTHRTNICRWLSEDPDHILELCLDIISAKECRTVEKQESGFKKMEVLLDSILQKGEPVCQQFTDVLQQQQGRYLQLQKLFSPRDGGSAMETYADDASIVSKRDIGDITAKKSVDVTIETVANPGGAPSGAGPGQGPQAKNVALRGSLVCRDTIRSITSDEGVNISLCVKSQRDKPTPSAECEGPADEDSPSSQEPAVKFIRDHKTALIECLRADKFILEYVHERGIVSQRNYENLHSVPQPEKSVIDLMNVVIKGGRKTCCEFLELLKEPKVVEQYPQLPEITNAW
ncbi:uncharacterized protein LOC115411900 isoform X2 [Sphaeramia orbicularis]|uniref:uncharacterized protein LOC115411900 isoform X2 n=1 Tax=Sphaeramia orbicularis TaxID=375764 RepID=UPI00117D3F15|nr:uncharacterized protein LOC115411900 isoform X2 [Sphaeramia orbicularis]